MNGESRRAGIFDGEFTIANVRLRRAADPKPARSIAARECSIPRKSAQAKACLCAPSFVLGESRGTDWSSHMMFACLFVTHPCCTRIGHPASLRILIFRSRNAQPLQTDGLVHFSPVVTRSLIRLLRIPLVCGENR